MSKYSTLKMSTRSKKAAENNGIEVGSDGNQKIDSMMEKPKKSEQKTDENDQGGNESKESTLTKREKEDEEGETENRPSKAAKKDEGHESAAASAAAAAAEGDGEKAQKPANEDHAAVLKPGTEEDMKGEEEGAFKVLERGQ